MSKSWPKAADRLSGSGVSRPRFLTPSGRCLISYFLLNEESLRLIETGASPLDFPHALEGCRTASREVPEAAIAFAEDWIRGVYGNLGLEVSRIDYGSWCGRRDYLSYQDLILAVKR